MTPFQRLGDTWWRYSGMRARNGSNILVVFACGWLRWRVRPSTVGGMSSNTFGLSGGDTSDVRVWSCPRGGATRASGAPPAGEGPQRTRRPTPPRAQARQPGWGKSSRSPPPFLTNPRPRFAPPVTLGRASGCVGAGRLPDTLSTAATTEGVGLGESRPHRPVLRDHEKGTKAPERPCVVWEPTAQATPSR